MDVVILLASALTHFFFLIQVFSLRKLNQSLFQRLTTNFIRGFSVLMVPVAASVPSVSCETGNHSSFPV